LHGEGSGNGIQVNSAGQVEVDDCISENFNMALDFVPSGSASLKVKGGSFQSSGALGVGISTCCAGSGTAANVAIDSATVYGAGNGINADALVLTLTRSSLTGLVSLSTDGVLALNGTTVIENDVISGYEVGVFTEPTGITFLSSNTITGNNIGVLTTPTPFSSGGTFSRGNNTIQANGSQDVGGILTPFAGQ
jgi:hypothetical protein